VKTQPPSKSQAPVLIINTVGFTMLKHVQRFTLAMVSIVAAACVYDAPVTPKDNSITAATTSNSPSLQVTASTATSGIAGRYLVVYRPGGAASSDVSAALRSSGGALEGAYDKLGFAVVSGLSPERAARLGQLSGVSSVEPDVEFAIDPVRPAEQLETGDVDIQSVAAPQGAFFYGFQWSLRAIAADAAWAGGSLGSPDVSVAILDTGIDYRLPDLAGLVDLNRSISLRPDEDARLADAVSNGWFPAGLHPITDLNAHGTLVASLVASKASLFAGVTSRTTLFGVKVCIVFNTCSTAAILNGIVYAVDQGADVINMSLGGAFLKKLNPGFVSVINRVFNYANRNGTVIVVAAGNEAARMDAFANAYFAYCDAPHVLCVSATGPNAVVGGQVRNPDTFASYSNFGRSVSVAAPGGGLTPSLLSFIIGQCSQTALAWHQDAPPSPGAPPPPPVIDGPACQPPPGFISIVAAVGTSFSSPHVAGVVALVIANGQTQPSQIRRIVERTSDDLGAKGKDPFFGSGRVNAARAVGAIP